jgi:hypothetical protein
MFERKKIENSKSVQLLSIVFFFHHNCQHLKKDLVLPSYWGWFSNKVPDFFNLSFTFSNKNNNSSLFSFLFFITIYLFIYLFLKAKILEAPQNVGLHVKIKDPSFSQAIYL